VSGEASSIVLSEGHDELVHAAGLVVANAGVDVAVFGDQVRLSLSGTKVEIIGTADDGSAEATIPELARLMVLSHRWALDSASLVTVMVAGSNATVTAPFATAPALLAMKLHAIQGRSSAGTNKKASDAWDIFRLLRILESPAAEFEFAPADLAELLASSLTAVFVSDSTRTRRSLREWGDPAWIAEMTEAAMIAAATPVVSALRS
jgi:hypothetical protein